MCPFQRTRSSTRERNPSSHELQDSLCPEIVEPIDIQTALGSILLVRLLAKDSTLPYLDAFIKAMKAKEEPNQAELAGLAEFEVPSAVRKREETENRILPGKLAFVALVSRMVQIMEGSDFEALVMWVLAILRGVEVDVGTSKSGEGSGR